ncbi:MAG: ABC transporter ATP-binding protein [Candidatus Saccharimonadales bacterium]
MPNRNTETDKLTVSHFWHEVVKHKKGFLLSLLIPVNAIALYTILPFLVGKILGSLTRPHTVLTPYIIGFIVVSIIGIIANRIGFVSLLSLEPKVMADLQTQCLSMLMQRGMSYHNNQVSGKLVSDAIDYPAAFSLLSNTLFTTIIPFLITIVSGLVLITYNSPILGLLMFFMSFLAIGSGVLQRRKMAPYRVERIKSTKDVTAHLADTVVNIQAVKTFGREQHELNHHSTLNTKLMNSRIHDWKLVATDGTNRIAGLLLFELLFILITVFIVRQNPALLATGIFAFSYTVTLTNKLFDIGTMMRSIEEALLQAEPMTLALRDTVEIKDIPHAEELKAMKGAITFSAVYFHYSDNADKTAVFENLSIHIKPGEKIGLVGPSGGGKSTITKLLLRFEDIQSGTITIADQNIAHVTQQSLRESIAYVPQESILFHRSIKDNISYGNINTADMAIVQAAKDAYAHDFITKLPLGYDTIVGERGVKLSGGQRQRIAIARAMLKDAPILILDEATSALDSESEKVIQQALWKLMENKTALVIAHRLSTIQRMDRILVLEDGKVVEDGSHALLLSEKGLYARLWTHQSGGFIEE